ncbi:ATP-binding cassette domain-containing protein [Leptolyngbya sp. 15MV]|nr:ATP-binding cassette domain-containing protein [Leptolyngbya sp. 15MV]
MIPATADPLPSEALAIDLRQVSKTYGRKVRALVDVALQVRRGEVFGLLGPNGAGKSTLVKILMSVISPSRCTGTMLGRHVGDKSALARVGYLPEHHRFPETRSAAPIVRYSRQS